MEEKQGVVDDKETKDDNVHENVDIESKASRMGWVSEEDFRGDKEKWITADEFIKRGESQLPIMKERLKKMDGKVVELEGTIAEMKETYRKFKEYHSDSEARQFKKAERLLAERQRAAVESQDMESFDSIEKEREALKKEMDEKNAKFEESNASSIDRAAMTVFNNWKAENEWYDEDDELQSYAQSISVHIQKTDGIGGRKLYDEVAKEVKARFPEKFGNKKRNTPNAVVGDGEHVANNKKHSFSNLPKEAQAECLRFIKEIPGFTREEYVENYEW